MHHIDYMVDDGRQVGRFIHALDEEVRTEVAMWKLTTMAEISGLARHV